MTNRRYAEQINRIINIIASKAVEMPPSKRSRFIDGAVLELREAFRQTYKGDPVQSARAMEFVDKIDGWTRALVRSRESAGGTRMSVVSSK
jgi:hypothetical protein